MRAVLLLILCTGCLTTPRRPPTAPPARIEMEALSRKHFLQGVATADERERLAALLDLHGRGDEAALLEAPDDPARGERAWFAGTRETPLWTAEAARGRLPAAQARLAKDPRAIRSIWLLGHAAQLDRSWLGAIADRWRRDWPESAEARIALRMSRAPAEVDQPVQLEDWAATHPLDEAAIRAAYAEWRLTHAEDAPPRWLALRVLAVWDGRGFRLREERLAMGGALQVRRRRSAFVPTADAEPIFRVIVKTWGAPVEARDGAVSPIQADGRWNARVDGIPARAQDSWAPSPGPRWVHAEAPSPQRRRARLHWRLIPRGEGWRGTLEADGLASDVEPLIDWLPNLRVHALTRLPGGGWRARIAFDGPPAQSLLDDRAVEALGGPISMARLATSGVRNGALVLPPASVEIRVTRMDVPLTAVGGGGRGGGEIGWNYAVGFEGVRTVQREWGRPAIDWSPAIFEQRRERARRAHADVSADFLRGHPVSALLFPTSPIEE